MFTAGVFYSFIFFLIQGPDAPLMSPADFKIHMSLCTWTW